MKAIEVDDTWREVLGVVVDENRTLVLLRDGKPVALLVPYPPGPALERKGGVEISFDVTELGAPSAVRIGSGYPPLGRPRGQGRPS